MTLEERFWAKVKKGEGDNACWIWTGALDHCGYGLIFWLGKPRRAHRISLQFKLSRAIREGMLALHNCDNPPCVRPEHLYEGTHADNGRDKHHHGRSNTGESTSRGERHYLAKLGVKTIARAKALRQIGWSEYAIAKRFGVSRSTIAQLFQGRSWNGAGAISGIDVRRKLTLEQRAEVFELQASGLTHDAIAARFNVTRGAVTRVLRNQGIPAGERHYHAKVTAEQVVEIRLLRKLYHVTQQELAANFGVGREGIKNIVLGVNWKSVMQI